MTRNDLGYERLPSAGDVCGGTRPRQREFFIDNLLVRIHFIIVMIRWTGLAPWEFEFPFPAALEATQGQTDSFFSQPRYKLRGRICGRLTLDLPLGYLQGGAGRSWGTLGPGALHAQRRSSSRCWRCWSGGRSATLLARTGRTVTRDQVCSPLSRNP